MSKSSIYRRRDYGTATIALTRRGSELAARIGSLLKSDVYLPKRFAGEYEEAIQFQKPLKSLVSEIFHKYGFLIFITPIGLVVRVISGIISDKYGDPGILVVDEAGRFVIPVLSSHYGKANILAKKLGGLLNATPVITTASDVNSLPSVDLLGEEFGWKIESEPTVVTHVCANVVNGDKVGMLIDSALHLDMKKIRQFFGTFRLFDDLDGMASSDVTAGLVITDKVLEKKYESLIKRCIIYRPKSLVIGIGLTSSATLRDVEGLVRKIFEENGLSMSSIGYLATLDRLASHRAIIEFAKKHEVLVRGFSHGELAEVEPPNPSNFVVEKVGLAGVCEPAALLCANTKQLLVEKSKSSKVALAVARMRGAN